MAASGEDSTLWMWDAAGFELRATHPVDRLLTSVAGNGNGGLVAAGDRHGQVLLWRPGEGVETPGPGRHLSAVSDLLFTPDEALLISASGTIRLWPLVVATAVSAETRPNSFALHPNPFNAATMIRFRLAQSGPVRLEVYNLLGQRVRMTTKAPHHPDFSVGVTRASCHQAARSRSPSKRSSPRS